MVTIDRVSNAIHSRVLVGTITVAFIGLHLARPSELLNPKLWFGSLIGSTFVGVLAYGTAVTLCRRSFVRIVRSVPKLLHYVLGMALAIVGYAGWKSTAVVIDYCFPNAVSHLGFTNLLLSCFVASQLMICAFMLVVSAIVIRVRTRMLTEK